jgi:hypothetical protein
MRTKYTTYTTDSFGSLLIIFSKPQWCLILFRQRLIQAVMSDERPARMRREAARRG